MGPLRTLKSSFGLLPSKPALNVIRFTFGVSSLSPNTLIQLAGLQQPPTGHPPKKKTPTAQQSRQTDAEKPLSTHAAFGSNGKQQHGLLNMQIYKGVPHYATRF